ncbi:hypothetical protein GQ457_11G032640 [Hibiscus cannabinus]
MFLGDQGEWLFGFFRSLGRCSGIMAELWVILHGLHHAWRLRFRQVVVESDCFEAVRLANEVDLGQAGNMLITAVRDLVKHD